LLDHIHNQRFQSLTPTRGVVLHFFELVSELVQIQIKGSFVRVNPQGHGRVTSTDSTASPFQPLLIGQVFLEWSPRWQLFSTFRKIHI